MLTRSQYSKLWQELAKEKPMIFLTGPRQAGKTTLAKQIQKLFSNHIYFNWDILSHRRKLIQEPTFFQNINRLDESIPLVIYDELHKYKDWKNYLKGIYDEFHKDYNFLVTGSGRLDLYRKGGDSLAGRYFLFHLFPFTVSELSTNKKDFLSNNGDWFSGFNFNNRKETAVIWEKLFRTGGFPEPFIKGSEQFFQKWTTTYIHQVIHEDIRVFADIKNINTLELLYSLLPLKVGSPLSINSIARDLQVSFDSIKSWLSLLETVFLTFKIEPWTKKISRSILKEKKWYLYNYAEIEDPGIRFENMVALELLRLITFWNDQGKGRFGLYYIRNKEKQEVDFVLTNKNNPFLLIEAKFSDTNPSKSLLDFQEKLSIPAIQLVHKNDVFKKIKKNNLRFLIITAHTWFASR